MAYYNILTAITCNFSIVLLYLGFFMPGLGLDVLLLSDFSCKINQFLTRVLTHLISWLNVLTSFDRMISVIYPYKHRLISKKRHIILSIMLVIIDLSIMNSTNLFYNLTVIRSVYVNATNTTVTTKGCVGVNTITEIADLVAIISRTLLPFFLMFFSNSALIVYLYKHRRVISTTRSMKKELNFSVSVIAQNIIFVLLMTPYSVAKVYQYNIDYILKSRYFNLTKEVVIFNIFYVCAACLSTYTSCYLFFVNVAFNKLFRKELRVISRQILFKCFPSVVVVVICIHVLSISLFAASIIG